MQALRTSCGSNGLVAARGRAVCQQVHPTMRVHGRRTGSVAVRAEEPTSTSQTQQVCAAQLDGQLGDAIREHIKPFVGLR